MSTMEVADRAAEKALVISSDGHASAEMADYRPYVPSRYHEEFDAFYEHYKAVGGGKSSDPKALALRLDTDTLDIWIRDMVERDRLAGFSNPHRRLEIMNEEGVAAELLFPDFGLPFQLGGPLFEFKLGHSRSAEQQTVADRAYNRWLADYCSTAPERLCGMASVTFDDVDIALEEIKLAREAGLKGIVLPMFSEEKPLFDPSFEPIWGLLEELDMPANSHSGMSSTCRRMPAFQAPHPAAALPLMGPITFFYCHQILSHLIWGGVFERHPRLRVVFTEQGSGWIPGALRALDYTWEGSYLRTDIREIVPRRPSEYFSRHCYVGSSIFSKAEIEIRHQIGVEKMMLGMDYPHHEGTFTPAGTVEYLRATLGAAQVPVDEARLMLSENAASIWGFDVERLRPLADEFGPSMDHILTPPETDRFPRGDVHKPLQSAAGSGG